MAEGELSFGAIRLWPQRRELSRDGVPIKLSSRGFEILLALLERPGELLTRRELMGRVWRGRVVEDANLAVQVSQLRQRLGVDGAAIRTEPGSGFRFVGKLGTAALAAGAASEAPQTLAASGQLPQRAGVLIGREAALDAVELELEAGRAVTLVGPGGIGKTRLAIETARRARHRFADGVFMIDLVPLTDVDQIVGALAEAVGAASAQRAVTLEAVLAHLQQRSPLLLFDNCEHVIEPAARIGLRLLAACPRVALLATSREPLRIEAERVITVPALALAPPEAIQRGDALRFPATRLFVDRIRAGKPTFEPTAAETTLIARMCRRLDGMPLALELAAGRVPALGVEQVAARLHSGLKILSGGQRSAARRHHTLQATLAWSHDLLAPAEQLAFRRLAVFANTFTLPAAEAVLAAPDLSDWDIVDAIESLVGKSLLVAEDETSGVRYRMLETTKAYAIERMTEAAEVQALAHRLARYVNAQCRDAERDYRSLESVTWLKRYGSELANLRAALEWDFGAAGDSRRGVETAVYSWPIWLETSPLEGQAWLDRCEAQMDDLASPLLRALLWLARGSLLPTVRVPEVAESFRRAASALRALGDERRLGEALLGLGNALSMMDEPEQSHSVLVEACSLIEKTGAPSSLAVCLQALAMALHMCGRQQECRTFYDAALALCRSIGPSRRAATTLLNLGNLSYNMGDLEAAIACTTAAAEQLRGWGGSAYHLAFALGNLAGFQIARGEFEAACNTAAEALPMLRSAGVDFWFFDHLAALAARVGDGEAAARFLGYADIAYARQNDCRQPTQKKAHQLASTLVHAQVDEARLQGLFLVGRSWTRDQALGAAQAFLRQCRTEPRPPGREPQVPQALDPQRSAAG